jgi:hypothetical protein
MSHRYTVTVVAAMCILLSGGAAVAQTAPDPWFMRSPRARDFEAPKMPLGGFTIELPKDWQLIPGFNTFLLIAAEKTRNNQPVASIVLERWQLADSLEVNQAMADYLLAEYLKKREPTVQKFDQEVKDVGGRKFVLTRYSRAGLSGQDGVVDYSIPIGSVLYRVTGIAPAAEIAKYQPIFAHVAFSLKAGS